MEFYFVFLDIVFCFKRCVGVREFLWDVWRRGIFVFVEGFRVLCVGEL